jgi:hypothetical protein
MKIISSYFMHLYAFDPELPGFQSQDLNVDEALSHQRERG